MLLSEHPRSVSNARFRGKADTARVFAMFAYDPQRTFASLLTNADPLQQRTIFII